MINLAEKVSQLEKKLNDLEKKTKSSLDDIILNSTFRVLPFYGIADGTNLTHQFNDSLFLDKSMLIKAIKFIPYYSADSEDISLDDGVTVAVELIPSSFRINRVFDPSSGAGVFLGAHSVNFLINGQSCILNVDVANEPGCIPPDYEMDNIFYLIKKVQSLDINMIQEVLTTLPVPGTTINPYIKVFIECYIF